jgi:hypothetical protein
MQIEATYCNKEHSQSVKCVPETLINPNIFISPQAFHAWGYYSSWRTEPVIWGNIQVDFKDIPMIYFGLSGSV